MRYLILTLILCSSAYSAEWTQKYITVKATFYCPCSVCCGKNADGKTAIGRDASLPGVAVDKKVIPLRSRIDIPGHGNWLLADDTGKAIQGNRIDIRCNSHEEALKLGVKELKIRVWTKEKE